ncbi:MAG: PrsW family intramembrane metalloprotease [Dehalococcoidales bacterium]|nr:PrsW family intramembrane metalloprotease [Dehalococcoidales bacterium]
MKKPLIQPWLQIFIVGALLYAGAEQALRITNNPNFFPTVILLGAFVVPITFVTYFYEHVRHREISLPLLTSAFVVGGVLGLLAAGVLEYGASISLSITHVLTVGIIEESVKLIFPLVMFIAWHHQHEADGLLFGLAVGMGFAALETMGYGLTTFVQSNGDIAMLQQVLILRGFVSPAGHAAWTGFVCAVLWRERERKGHVAINGAVIGAFAAVIILHTLWDLITDLPFIIAIIGNLIIAIISLTLLFRRYRESKKSLQV